MFNESQKLTVYTGASMHPTLKAPDLLQVIPYNGRKIKRGDVIAFQPPGGVEKKITHRVISADPNGIRTHGDNNNNIDYFLLKPNDIIGKVVSVWRGNRNIRIHGGKIGELIFIKNRVLRKLDRKISALLHPLYHRLAQSGIFRLCLPSSLMPRFITFKKPSGNEVHLFMGKHVIGKLLPGKEKWKIQRPFRLFVDESSLPQLQRRVKLEMVNTK